MKQTIDYLKESTFLKLIRQNDTNPYFSIDNQSSLGGMLRENQITAIQEYGGFLSLVPEEDYPNVAFGLLKQINNYNLSMDGYVFSSLDMKTVEKKVMEKDLKLAEKYYESIKNSPSAMLVSLVKQNIEDIKHKLHFEQKVYDNNSTKNYTIIYKEYQTIGLHQYEPYSKGDKFTKQDIRNWLDGIVKAYEIKGYSKNIKKLTDEL